MIPFDFFSIRLDRDGSVRIVRGFQTQIAGRLPVQGKWGRRPWWCLALVLMTGCWTTSWSTKRDFRPPPQPEEYVLPPAAVSRFEAPPDYPREAQKDKLAKNRTDEPGMPNVGPGGSRFGTGPGMRP
jgi:hypothetical protein